MNETTHLNGETLKKLLLGGLSNLQLHKEEVDALNVFPVPDGDTGTNMSMTLQGGSAAVEDAAYESVSELMQAYAKGCLLGARGNSGVILSQFIKGLAGGLEGLNEATAADFCEAFALGKEKAYEAVIHPTEGTMLTLMKDGSLLLQESTEPSFESLLAALNARMRRSLDDTPSLLPVLKEAGVVDSGGAGFLYIFEGMEQTLRGEEIHREESWYHAPVKAIDFAAFTADSTLEFGYCTEGILRLQNTKVDISSFDKKEIVDYLEQAGDSIVAVQDADLVKIHVHTFRPGDVLNYCQKFGEFLTIKIDNMSVQHNEILKKKEETPAKIQKPIAIVAALSGEGLKECFQGIGVDYVVDGGQTENPSAEDFLEAFSYIEAEHILVLPCNSNIVMTASQAAAMRPDTDIRIIKAKTVAEGYAALSMMNLSLSVDEVVRDMEQAIRETETGLITTATRDVAYDSLQVTKGHFIGLNGEKVLSDSPDRLEAVRALLAATEDIKEKAILVVFYGKNTDPEERGRLEKMLRSEFSWLEFGLIDGAQDVYDYIFAIE